MGRRGALRGRLWTGHQRERRHRCDDPEDRRPQTPDGRRFDHGLSGGALTVVAAASLALQHPWSSPSSPCSVISRHRVGFLAAVLLAPSVSAANTVNGDFRSASSAPSDASRHDIHQEGWVGGLVLTKATNPLIYRVDSPDRADIHLLESVVADLTGGYAELRVEPCRAGPCLRPGSG